MSNIDWFSFENKDLDFPFYKKNPYVPKWGWIILFLAVGIGFIVASGESLLFGMIGCCISIIPVLYFLKWDYRAIFQVPKAKEIALAVGLCFGYLIYSFVLGTILGALSVPSATLVDESTVTIWSIPPLLFSLMGEEFIKFVPFVFFLRLFYKYTDKRKLSVIVSMLLVMVFFAYLHAMEPKYFLYAFCLQGLGSIFEFIGYIKTKNILISYITHLCTDAILFLMMVMEVNF